VTQEMTIVAAGTKFGPLRNHSALDADGMREVHSARDPKLARDVAAELDSLAVGGNWLYERVAASAVTKWKGR